MGLCWFGWVNNFTNFPNLAYKFNLYIFIIVNFQNKNINNERTVETMHASSLRYKKIYKTKNYLLYLT